MKKLQSYSCNRILCRNENEQSVITYAKTDGFSQKKLSEKRKAKTSCLVTFYLHEFLNTFFRKQIYSYWQGRFTQTSRDRFSISWFTPPVGTVAED